MKDAHLFNLLRQSSIQNDNQLMELYDSSRLYIPDTGRGTGAYIIFIKMGKLTMAHMFQDQFFNKLQKVSTIQH